MRYPYLSCFIIFSALISSCIKNPVHLDILPIRANPDKFECFVNGKDYVPDSNRISWSGGPVFCYVKPYDNDIYNIQISANIKGYGIRADQSVTLEVQDVTGPGIYEFNQPNNQYAQYALFSALNAQSAEQHLQYTFYNDHTAGHGQLTLTKLDIKNQVAAGTFWFNAVNNNNPADSVKVTGGHFNIIYGH